MGMGKFVIALVIAGLVAFVVRELMKINKRENRQADKRKELDEAKERLNDLSLREDVLNIEEKAVKVEEKVQKRERKLDKAREKLSPEPSDGEK